MPPLAVERQAADNPPAATIDKPAAQDARIAPPLLALHEIASSDRFALEGICREQAQPLYLGDHTAICRALTRYKLFVDTRDCGFAAHVLLDGFWEMWLTMFMCRYVRPGMVAIDVGANFGYYTLLLADLVGPEGHAFAIEPNPHVTALLRRSVTLNGFAERTTIVEAAAGAYPAEEALLYSPHGEFKNARLIEARHHADPQHGTLHQIRQTTIDDIVAQSPRLDFLKIDAEGAEAAIVEGMDRALAAHRPSIILEFNARRGKEPAALLRRLISLYHRVSYVDFHSNLVETTESELMTRHAGEDWLLFFDRDIERAAPPEPLDCAAP